MKPLRNPPLYPRWCLQSSSTWASMGLTYWRSLYGLLIGIMILAVTVAYQITVSLWLPRTQVLFGSAATRYTTLASDGLSTPISLQTPVAITGAQSGVDKLSGRRPSRLDFRTFQNSGPAFDLYLQCQQQFMDTDASDILSYHQIAC